MKRLYRTLCALMLAPVALSSCLGDDDDKDTTTYSDVAITSFQMGTLNRYTSSTSATTGNDTIIKTTITGSSYAMTIDHVGQAIYNVKALPVGTDCAHVVCTVTTKNGGVVAIQSAKSDSLSWLSSTDSIDFTTPRTLRVYANDGSAFREYVVTLNVSSTAGVDFAWTMARESSDLAAWTDARLVPFADSVLMVERGTVVRNDTAFRVGADGRVEMSLDGAETWATANGSETTPVALTSLLGASTREIYALADDGRLMASADPTAAEWLTEELDAPASLLPTDNIAMCRWDYAPADSTDYVLMTGNNDGEAGGLAFWRKTPAYGQGATAAQWIYMPVDDINRYTLPRQDCLSLTWYDGAVLALGSDMTIYRSRDEGISWRKDTAHALPDGATGQRAAMTTDKQGRLWVLTDSGQLWVGMLR